MACPPPTRDRWPAAPRTAPPPPRRAVCAVPVRRRPQPTRGEIIASVDDDIGTAEQIRRIIRVNPHGDYRHFHIRIDPANRRRRRVTLARANVIGAKDRLSLKV